MGNKKSKGIILQQSRHHFPLSFSEEDTLEAKKKKVTENDNMTKRIPRRRRHQFCLDEQLALAPELF